MKFDASKLLPETISLVLSMLIYDEYNFNSFVQFLFGFETHCFTDKTGRYFYAAVVDKTNNRTWIIFRGTDGKNWLGRLLSWTTINMLVLVNRGGFHRGFFGVAVKAMAGLAQYTGSGDVYVSGHSQGGAVSVVFLTMLCRLIVRRKINVKYVQADLWSAPPAVNEKGKKEIDGYIIVKICRCFNWVESGDLISGKLLRKKRGLFAGRNVGKKIMLPNIIPDKYGILDAVSHSPRLVLYAYKDQVPHSLDKDLIKFIIDEEMVKN